MSGKEFGRFLERRGWCLVRVHGPVIVVLVVVGAVIGRVAVSSGGKAVGVSGGKAIGVNRLEKGFIDAQGNPIVGVKDFAAQEQGWPEPHYYTTGPFFTRASTEEAAVIDALLRSSVELEYAAMLTANRGVRVEAIKQEYASIYSDEKGDLTKHLGYIDLNAELLDQDGYAQKELRLTRFEVKGIEVQGDQATAVVEEESLGVRALVRDQPTPDTLTIRSGRQIKFYLVRQGHAWMILGENWAFLPGMEP